jgi:hypothetical protein
VGLFCENNEFFRYARAEPIWNFIGLFMNMDKDFKEALQNLKKVMEK